MRLRKLAGAFAALMLAVGATAVALPPASATSLDGQAAGRLHTLINEYRAQHALKPLAWNGGIAAVSQGWTLSSAETANVHGAGTFLHNPNFAANYPAGAKSWSENIAWNMSVDQAFAWWTNSAPHRANMLRAADTDLGIGVVQLTEGPNKGVYLATVNFGEYAGTAAPLPPAPEPTPPAPAPEPTLPAVPEPAPSTPPAETAPPAETTPAPEPSAPAPTPEPSAPAPEPAPTNPPAETAPAPEPSETPAEPVQTPEPTETPSDPVTEPPAPAEPSPTQPAQTPDPVPTEDPAAAETPVPETSAPEPTDPPAPEPTDPPVPGPAAARGELQTSDPALLTPEARGSFDTRTSGSALTVTGLTPGAEYQVFLHSTPVNAGLFTVDANGVLRIEIPSGLEAGEHRVALYNLDGTLEGWQAFTVQPEVNVLGVAVSAGPGAPAELASTGFSSGQTVLGASGAVMIIAGAAALLYLRRTRTESAAA
ncbi:CAP domain-containing protein [Arthrobacter sp.]|uniref:CAP domain-containing protein n=1 Tax=Arthrobacter sp. TaxID=1667 RepID=UPI00289FEE26|nr:CAP domain-containing protein [Arthrobacter sp.]